MGFFPTFKETRSKAPSDDYWYSNFTGMGTTSAGVDVNEANSIKYLTVFACVSLIAGDIGRVPLILYKRKGDSKKRAVNHPLYDILHSVPNSETTSFNWRETSQTHLLLWGNTYSQIIRNGVNNIIGLVQIPDPGGVELDRKSGQLFYKWSVNGKEFVKRREDIFHVPGFGYNGLKGFSLIALARESIGLAMALEEFGSRYFGEGTHPTGQVNLERSLGDPEKKKQWLKDFKNQYASLGKTHNVMVLDKGVEFKSMAIPMEDAQFLGSRDHQKSDICGMYHVPPHKVALHGSNSNYSNLEQENQGYIDSCLIHWVTRWEQNISMQLLTPKERRAGYFAEFELKGLLRGDSQARKEIYSMFLNSGVPMNRILALENMEPVEGGDVGYIQGAMVPVNQIAEINKAKIDQMNKPKVAPIETKEPDESQEPASRMEKRAIDKFNKIEKEAQPAFWRTAQNILEYETPLIKKALDKITRTAGDDMSVWLEGFYDQHRPYVRNKFAPVMEKYARTINAEASRIIGKPIGMVPELEEFMHDYLERYAFRYCHAGKRQLQDLIIANALDPDAFKLAITERLDEWLEKSADKIKEAETVRMSNAVARETWKDHGVTKLRWVAIGKSCPFCNYLNGKVVGIEKNFLEAGEVIYISTKSGDSHIYNPLDPNSERPDVDYDDPLTTESKWQALKTRGPKAHAPIHRGCDCKVMPE